MLSRSPLFCFVFLFYVAAFVIGRLDLDLDIAERYVPSSKRRQLWLVDYINKGVTLIMNGKCIPGKRNRRG